MSHAIAAKVLGKYDLVGGHGTPHSPLVNLPIDEMGVLEARTRLRSRKHDATTESMRCRVFPITVDILFHKHRKDVGQRLGSTLAASPSQFPLVRAAGYHRTELTREESAHRLGAVRHGLQRALITAERQDAPVARSPAHNPLPRRRNSPYHLPRAGACVCDVRAEG